MIAECYTMYLYCRRGKVSADTDADCKTEAASINPFPHHFMGQTRGDCVRQARARGEKLKTIAAELGVVEQTVSDVALRKTRVRG